MAFTGYTGRRVVNCIPVAEHPELASVFGCLVAMADCVHGHADVVAALSSGDTISSGFHKDLVEFLSNSDLYNFSAKDVASAFQLLEVLYQNGELKFMTHIKNMIANWTPSNVQSMSC